VRVNINPHLIVARIQLNITTIKQNEEVSKWYDMQKLDDLKVKNAFNVEIQKIT
jgi:hypothetical protein